MTSVGTTPIQLLQRVVGQSFVVEADPGNSGTVKISSVDQNVAASFISLLAGQQQPFVNWTGTLYALGSASGQNVYVELLSSNDGGPALSKGP